jgi:hypothetical protein
MKWRSVLRKVFLFVVSFFTFAFSFFTLAPTVVTEAKGITITSNNMYWTVSDANGVDLGNAQNVCLSATEPSNCPPGATVYGYSFPGGWGADLSGIPGATWIWAPNITGSTSGAANAEFSFKSQFWLCGAPVDGTIFLATDDSAEVFVNNTSVGNSTSHSTLSSITVAASILHPGPNDIEIKAKNAENPPDCESGQYQCNPAGLVFGGSFADALTTWPTCDGKEVGTIESSSCPAGQDGSKGRICACFGSIGVWTNINTCKVPPVKCMGDNGGSYNVNDVEQILCPTGQTGTASHTCLSNGSWGPTDTSLCVPPPVTCTGLNGAIYNVGATETVALSCPAGQTGSGPRNCQANGSWSQPSGICKLPQVGVGEICGSSQVGQTATCPVGTTCGSRALPTPPRSFWCAVFGIDCPVRLKTVDWFCDAP